MISPQKLIEYASAHPEWVKMVTHPTIPNLVKLNYRHRAMYDSQWSDEVIQSRGIIIDTDTHTVIARPFDKFFNLGERMQLDELPSHLDYWIIEKLDGVLVIPFKYDDNMFVSTRGSFDNEFTDIILKDDLYLQLEDLEYDSYTHMFELIHPDARIVTNYGDQKSLILIGIRKTESGKQMDPDFVQQYAAAHGLKVFEEHDSGEDAPIEDGILEDMKEWPSDNIEEGWVIQFESGLLIKIKRTEYIELVKLIQKVSFRHIINYMLEDKYDEYHAKLPEEVQLAAGEIRQQIDHTWIDISSEINPIEQHIEITMKDATRKDRALWLKENHPDMMGVMFALMDGKPREEVIMQHIKRNRKELFGEAE